MEKRGFAVLQDYKDNIKMKGELLVLTTFPDKILKLNNLINSSEWNFVNSSDYVEKLPVPVPSMDGYGIDHHGTHNKKRKVDDSIEEEPIKGSKVLAFINGVVPCNSKLVKLADVVKPFLKELIYDSNVLKMWLSLMIPKIEDGNNFGVSVQEDTLAEIQAVESEGSQYYDQITRYYVSRGKLITKVAKYPHVEDYRRSVSELDEKQYLSLCLVLKEIQNRYSVMHDIVTKNLDKLKQPRNSNSISLY